MALGKQGDRGNKMFLSWNELPKSPGHVFYDRLQSVLNKAGFDRFAEGLCAPLYASRRGPPSIPPGRYFRMHLVGYLEGIDSEREVEWRCADSLSLREFLLLETGQTVPHHSSLSRIRSRLPLELHQEIFSWVLDAITQAGLVQGEHISVDASTMEANAAMRTIVRKDTGEGYRQMLHRMAKESGMDTLTNEDLSRMDRQRKGKKTSNKDWESPTDPEAKVARIKDGRTRLAYKPEHAVDLNTSAVVGVDILPADQGDTKTLGKTLKTTKANLKATGKGSSPNRPTELVADKGYHSRAVLKGLNDSPWKTRIAERSFQHTLDRGYAQNMAARPEQRRKALPAPLRRFQSRPAHEKTDRVWHPERGSRCLGTCFFRVLGEIRLDIGRFCGSYRSSRKLSAGCFNLQMSPWKHGRLYFSGIFQGWDGSVPLSGGCFKGTLKNFEGEHPMKNITIIGIDLAKDSIQLHGVDSSGKFCLRKTLRRSQASLFFANLPACATSAYLVCVIESCGHTVVHRIHPRQAVSHGRQERRQWCGCDL